MYACEMSEPMVQLASLALQDNKLQHRIALIAKHSESISLAKEPGGGHRTLLQGGGEEGAHMADLPDRVHVVVTETADCGLLGQALHPKP